MRALFHYCISIISVALNGVKMTITLFIAVIPSDNILSNRPKVLNAIGILNLPKSFVKSTGTLYSEYHQVVILFKYSST